jgi:hypothetical protein
MNLFEFLAIAIVTVCGAGAVVLDRMFGPGRRAGEHQIRLAEQRVQELLTRINELERHNEDLRQQLEWNRRLLEAQDRVLQQLGAPQREAELAASRSRV